jgi:hypothetical protein
MPVLSKLVVPATGAGILVALALTFASVETGSPPERREVAARAGAPAEDPNQGAHSEPAEPSVSIRDEGRAAAGSPLRTAVAVTSLPGEDELTSRWAALSPEERARELRGQYREALGAMRRGADFQSNRAIAEAAVSALRAELYGTPAGREDHERLEQGLQALVERERGREDLGSGGAP